MPSDSPFTIGSEGPPGSRAFGDVDATRTAIYDGVFKTASTLPDVTNKTHTLRLSGVKWQDPEDVATKRDRKHASLSGGTLGRRLKGTWELLDNASGRVIDKREQVIARVPHMTDGGTFVHDGSEYSIRNQQRLRSGVFVREQDNGEVEGHVNVLSGGPSHHYRMDPAKGVFRVNVGQANIPAMPLLKHLGATDKEIQDAWGPDLYARNAAAADGSATGKYVEKFLKGVVPEGRNPSEALTEAFGKMKLDPEVTHRTLGRPFDHVDKDVVLATTRKLLDVHRKQAKPDDRDHLAFQTFMGPEDLFAERLAKDQGGLRRTLLFRASMNGNLDKMPSSALQQHFKSVLLESGLAAAAEEVNPLELLDKNTATTRLGVGGIRNMEGIPDSSRAVSASQYGFIDPLRTPESLRAGVDTFFASNARKGRDGKLYGRFADVRTGQPTWKTPQEIADSVVTFPGAMGQPGKRVQAMKGGRLTWARKDEVNYVIPAFEHAFSPLGNLVPLKSMSKGQRIAMGGRFLGQALPLQEPEAPLVQGAMPGTNGERSYEEEYGRHAGAVHAHPTLGGRVLSTEGGSIKVRHDDGSTADHELHDYLPHNRKTFIHQSPVVQAGDRFEPGQLLAKSNFTDARGTTAIGLNARVAYIPWRGLNHEDAIVISDSLSKRLSSVHAYQHSLQVHENTRAGRNAYVRLFPAKYDNKTLKTIDHRGLILPGTEVKFGDPLILAAEERAPSPNKVHKRGAASHADVSVTWEHHDPGVVTDVVEGRDGPTVVVKSVHPMREADKLSGRHGNKGVVHILPDSQMPHDAAGKHYEAALNPLGVISRANVSQVAETLLGKVARKTGRPFKVEDFDARVPDRMAWVGDVLRRTGTPDTEDVYDPVRNTKIPGVLTGEQFLMKLHHTAESKTSERGMGGGYTAEGAPAKGKDSGSKRLALMETNALLSHGALGVIRDASLVRGQQNEDYWLQFMQGHTPRDPKVPIVYQKFVDQLKAAGINPVPDSPGRLHLMAMTDRDVDTLAGRREPKNGDSVQMHGGGLKPIEGGLFDPLITGGHEGTHWSAIPLAEPMPNPAFEEPIQRLLGLTKKRFVAVLSGREPLRPNEENGATGPKAISDALRGIDVDKELAVARNQFKFGNKDQRAKASSRIGYLKSSKLTGVHPGDWVLKRAPVLPPRFRPVSVMGGSGIPIVEDPNLLYKELFEANANLGEMRKRVGDKGAVIADEREAVYNAFKGVVGLGEPITQANQDRQTRGILKSVLGSSGKFSTVQNKLLSSAVGNVGRSVIVPDPDLDMDSVGLPEKQAFDVFGRFVVRELKRSGMRVSDAIRHVRERTPLARSVLEKELAHRPTIVSRAPVLHRYGIMAFRPRLVAGDAVHMPPLVFKGFGMDADGDAVNWHAPVSEEARVDALERMLPSRQLLSSGDFKTPMHQPAQEYQGGAWTATSPMYRSGRHHTFRNAKDVRHAWLAGEVGVDDLVTVLEQARAGKS